MIVMYKYVSNVSREHSLVQSFFVLCGFFLPSPTTHCSQVSSPAVHLSVNPLKCSGVKWLHLKVSNAIQV